MSIKRSLYIMLLMTCMGFVKITTIWISQSINLNNYTFEQMPSLSTSADLYFAIGPHGEPQYGKSVNWNLPTGTNDQARFYRIKKGDFGLAAIDNTNENINFSGFEFYDPDLNPGFDLDSDWIKVESSWNFAPNSYNIVVIGFTNHNSTAISNGFIEMQHPLAAGLNFQELKIYNNWIDPGYSVHNDISAQSRIYTFEYDNLEPGETRYIYLYLNLIDKKNSESRLLSQFDIQVDMIGFDTDTLTNNLSPVPHDPNAMYLMNSYYQGTFQDCSSLITYPEMYTECLNENISWFSMGDTPCVDDEYEPIDITEWDIDFHQDEKKPCHITDYPYCHVNFEHLFYRVTCFNDGAGIAKDVIIKSNFINPAYDPFVPPLNKLVATSNYPLSSVISAFGYPDYKFLLEDINLPGLADPDIVYMYSECSSAIEFKSVTQCALHDPIYVGSSIVFTDINQNLQPAFETNKVLAIPYEPYNSWQYCDSCADGLEIEEIGRRSINDHTIIEIFSTNGIPVYRYNPTKNPANSDVRDIMIRLNLNTGVYFIKKSVGSKTTTSKMFFMN